MIRGYRGDAQRERDLTLGPIAPWHATITVDAVYLDRGRHTLHPRDLTFEVAVEWTGPPAAGFPPSDRPVQGRDVWPVHDHQLARAIARRTAAEFARGGDHPPDIREIARALSRRLRLEPVDGGLGLPRERIGDNDAAPPPAGGVAGEQSAGDDGL